MTLAGTTRRSNVPRTRRLPNVSTAVMPSSRPRLVKRAHVAPAVTGACRRYDSERAIRCGHVQVKACDTGSIADASAQRSDGGALADQGDDAEIVTVGGRRSACTVRVRGSERLPAMSTPAKVSVTATPSRLPSSGGAASQSPLVDALGVTSARRQVGADAPPPARRPPPGWRPVVRNATAQP